MPRRNDIKSILLIGSGPIVIGQACEFDYSGTQAIKALKEEGYRVILVNSNPATIMTDPEFADRTYIEPLTPDFVEEIIAKERPDAVITTMGGQTALNLALDLEERGVFAKYGCKLIGANVKSIKTAEDRDLFRKAMDEIGLESARSGIAHTLVEAIEVSKTIGFPCVIRPSRTLGGSGGGIVRTAAEFEARVNTALTASPNSEILIEESLLGWKEVELEVMRDTRDNVVIVCHIENFDPMGVHTGDSITVAPIQTLTDKEYQLLRDASLKIMRKIGIESGGSNVQLALNPKDGRIIVIEMNPRVSRSSALASKATGFPIARIAAKLAVGYTLDEIRNDITKETPSCFEPSIDYVVVKIPRFNFEKFPGADNALGTQMKSVGEVMAFGRNFSEALQKAMNSLELDSAGFDRAKLVEGLDRAGMVERAQKATPERLWIVGEAFRAGATEEELYAATAIDRWFLEEVRSIIELEQSVTSSVLQNSEELRYLKVQGFSDARIAKLAGVTFDDVLAARKRHSIIPVYKTVDTCAAEFKADTPYLYSCYDQESESLPTNRKKIVILGSGPNRIGQGIEFDYCCVHAVFALKEEGYEAIMVNCNPETVSTDYDISDRLYFEPLTLESVLSIVDRERPDGVIVQFGGQTPLKLAAELEERGVPIIGTSVQSIEIAEDRELFTRLIEKLALRQPENATASSVESAIQKAKGIGYPLVIRPSFVLGGRAMRILHKEDELREYFTQGVDVSNSRPVLLDRYLNNAVEVDVDAVSDGKEVMIAGIMEHIERAGIHSGDSSCATPPPTLLSDIQEELKRQTIVLAKELKVVGLMNIQFAVTSNNKIYVLEVNPRASRTVPYISKACGVPWAKVAAKLMTGRKLMDLGIQVPAELPYTAVKAVVFPFNKFEGVDRLLGPEMKSTGEVMGIDATFQGAFFRSQCAASTFLPKAGQVFLSLKDDDKADALILAPKLIKMGYELIATKGTAEFLNNKEVPCKLVNKVRDGSPHVVDLLKAGQIAMVVNTPERMGTFLDSKSIRLTAHDLKVPSFTTMAAAMAAVEAMEIMKHTNRFGVKAIQDYLASLKPDYQNAA
jgi:carbamoyl-phosphate synthase large subunit